MTLAGLLAPSHPTFYSLMRVKCSNKYRYIVIKPLGILGTLTHLVALVMFEREDVFAIKLL